MSAELQASRHQAALVLALSGSGPTSLLQADIHAALIETLSTAESDRSLAAVVLTGLDCFTPAQGKPASAPLSESALAYVGDWTEAIRAFPKPVIAAVEGQVAGPGLSLMLACDLVVAGLSSCFRASASMPGGTSWFLGRGLPHQSAMEMLLEAQPLPAARLHALGLVNRLVDDGAARGSALEWAGRLASDTGGAEGIKALLQKAWQHTLAQQLAAETQYRMEN